MVVTRVETTTIQMTRTGSTPSGTGERHHWTQTCCDAAAEGRTLHVRIHTRSVVPAFGTRDYHDEVRERVRRLADVGTIDDVSVEAWGNQVGTTHSEHVDAKTAATVETYQAWADRHDVALPFEERHCNSTLIDDTYTVLVPPHLLLAVADGDGTVIGVAPTVDGSASISVMDLLTRLADRTDQEDHRASASA